MTRIDQILLAVALAALALGTAAAVVPVRAETAPLVLEQSRGLGDTERLERFVTR